MTDEAGKEGKTVAAVIRGIFIMAGEDEELTAGQKLRILDILRNIANNDFSAESVRAGLRSCDTGIMRYYIRKFLREVGKESLLLTESECTQTPDIPVKAPESGGAQTSDIPVKAPATWNANTWLLVAGITLLVVACPITFYIERDIQIGFYYSLYAWIVLVVLGSFLVGWVIRAIVNHFIKQAAAMRSYVPSNIPFRLPPDPANEEEYVHRCLESEFLEEPETRTFRSDPALATVLTPLNAKEYAQAIKAGESLLSRFSDFDLIYKWLGRAYLATFQRPKSLDILCEGLGKAKRKSLLLTDLGDTEWQVGNIHEAVYCWAQALHCLAPNPIDCNAYLFLSYVAKGLLLTDFEQLLLGRVDSLQGGQMRLEPALAKRLTKLVQNKKTEAMQKTLMGLQSEYFS